MHYAGPTCECLNHLANHETALWILLPPYHEKQIIYILHFEKNQSFHQLASSIYIKGLNGNSTWSFCILHLHVGPNQSLLTSHILHLHGGPKWQLHLWFLLLETLTFFVLSRAQFTWTYASRWQSLVQINTFYSLLQPRPLFWLKAS